MITLITLYISNKNDEGDVSKNIIGGIDKAIAESLASAV